jgi:hypothetical protein
MAKIKIYYDCEFLERGPNHPIELISIGMIKENGEKYYAIIDKFVQIHERSHQWLKDNVFPHLFPQLSEENVEEGLAIIKKLVRSITQIKKDIIKFVGNDIPVWYGYYSAYDHVVLSQIFGKMIDLPEKWPMYTIDLKQYIDLLGNPDIPEQDSMEHNALNDAMWNKKLHEYLIEVGKQKNIYLDCSEYSDAVENHKKGWYGFDLDACLAEYTYWKGEDHIGKPVPNMVKIVKDLLAEGNEVKIFTARAFGNRPQAIKVVKEWCKKHIGQELEVTCVKDFGMRLLYDDRAVQVIENTGELLQDKVGYKKPKQADE